MNKAQDGKAVSHLKRLRRVLFITPIPATDVWEVRPLGATSRRTEFLKSLLYAFCPKPVHRIVLDNRLVESLERRAVF